MKAKIATLALLSSAFFSTSAFAATVTEHTLYCDKSDFQGAVQYTKTTTPYTTKIHVHRYKITKLHGVRGGNKANINLNFQLITNKDNKFHIYPASRYWSPDNRKQDGSWHSMNWNLHYDVQPQHIADLIAQADFIFDKSNSSDPKCNVEIIHNS